MRAVCDRGLDVDSILVITYTRRAAGELRTRIRHALGERGRPDLARELDGAWISTIHGFCLRLLKAYPFAAGLDPRFRELDGNQGAVLRSEAFKQALAEFCAEGEPDRLPPARHVRRLRAAADAHRRLRDASLRRPRAPARHRRPSRAGGARGGAARGGARAGRGRSRHRHPARQCAAAARAARPRHASGPADGAVRLPRERRACSVVRGGAPLGRASGARRGGRARPRPAAGAAEPLRRRVRRGEGARVGARLRGPAARRARPAPRPRRDPRARVAAVPLDHGGRVPGHEPSPDRHRRPAARTRRRAVLRR